MIRYIRKATRVYQGGCKWCGTHWGQPVESGQCSHTTCKACGSGQCMGNGLGRGQCGVCLIGLLPGWSGTDRPCGYKGCPERAIAACDRVGFCCAKHATRATQGGMKVYEYLQECMCDRDPRGRFVKIDDSREPAYVNDGRWLEVVSNLAPVSQPFAVQP
jgi:hypothetical protein